MQILTIREAADRLGISENTVRRRLRTGVLRGYQDDPPYGKWLVELPDEDIEAVQGAAPAGDGLTAALVEALRESLRRQDEALEALGVELESRRREVQELHVLLQQAQAALPSPRNGRSWWRWWQRD